MSTDIHRWITHSTTHTLDSISRCPQNSDEMQKRILSLFEKGGGRRNFPIAWIILSPPKSDLLYCSALSCVVMYVTTLKYTLCNIFNKFPYNLVMPTHAHYCLIFSHYSNSQLSSLLNCLTFTEHQTVQKMRLNSWCLNLLLKSFASLRGFCFKYGAIHISTAGDTAAHYQHPSSSDMLWRLAMCAAALTGAAWIFPYPFSRSDQCGVRRTSATCVKAWTQHEMGFIRKQLCLLIYLNTRSRLSNWIKSLLLCAESILISSALSFTFSATSSPPMTK